MSLVITADRLDDLLQEVISRILSDGQHIDSSRGGSRELFGVLLRLEDPRARLSRTETKGTLFSGLGELLWYLARSNSLAFIHYYAPRYALDSTDLVTIHGAYGPRLFNMRGIDQMTNVLHLLRRKPTSRRAVIQLFDAADLVLDYKEIPCTCTLQFAVRDQRLNMLTSMRSNDAFWGLPHDVFAFTMIQELFARSLNLEVGFYEHVVGSLHIYEERMPDAKTYLTEVWQEKVPMPPMPGEDPWNSIKTVLDAEASIREGQKVDVLTLDLAPYWRDILILLQIYRRFKTHRTADISRLQKLMTSRVYDPYIEKKKNTTAREPSEVPQPRQLPLFAGPE